MRILFLLFISVLFSEITSAQVFSNDSLFPDEKRFLYEVKQLDQFIKRFNNEEYILTGEEKTKVQLLKEKENEIEFQTERKKSILSLFNFEDSSLIYNNNTLDFINYAGDDSNHVRLDYYDENWFAKINCSVKYKVIEHSISLTLKKEGTNKDGYKWVIMGVSAPFINLQPIQKDTAKFISPMNHELGFMDLYKVFKDYSNITEYLYKNFKPDDLSAFLSLVNAKEIQFLKVNSIQYHFLQIKNWIFTIDYYNRPAYNSGWLLSSIKHISDLEKMNYKKSILFLTQ